MVVLNFAVRGSVLSARGKLPQVTTRSNKFFTLNVELDDVWSEYTVTVFFSNKAKPDAAEDVFPVLLHDGSCIVPHEVLDASDTAAYVWLMGLKDDVRATTNIIPIPLTASGYLEGIAPEEPSPDVYTEILESVRGAYNIANDVRADADAGKFNGVYYGTTPPTGDTHPVWIDPDGGPDDGGLLPAVTAADNGKVLRVVNSAWSAEDMPTGGTDMGITGATVGQIAKITAVDASGAPTAWAPVDMPGGGGGETWEEIKVITLADDVNTVTINTDSGGNALALKKVRILIEGSATHLQDLFLNNARYFRGSVAGTGASVGALSAEPFCGKMYCFAVMNNVANYAAANQFANIFSKEIVIAEIKLIVNDAGTFSAGTKFTIQGVRT